MNAKYPRNRTMNANDHNSKTYEAKQKWHKDQANLPIKEKFRILLRLQRDDLPLIKRLRELKWYEKPWEISVD